MNRSADKAILVMAGEPSGDRAAGEVVSELNSKGDYNFFGVGGDCMARVGVDLLHHIDELTALGLSESIKRFGRWTDVWCKIREACNRIRPKVALLVDSPEVNLPLARILTEAGTKVVFYIGPQVWAWRPSRLELMKDRTDITALVLPFEKTIYDNAEVKAVFVGHPIMDQMVAGNYNSVREELGVTDTQRLVAFLPGSRPGELERHTRPMVETVEMLGNGGVRSVVVPANQDARDLILDRFDGSGAIVAPNDLTARQVLRGSDGAVVCSGTATLEATVECVPHVIVYRMDRLSWLAGRLLVKTPFIGLPNIVAGGQVVPELVQEEVTGPEIFEKILALLEEDGRSQKIEALREVSRKLGGAGAADRVANLVLERL